MKMIGRNNRVVENFPNNWHSPAYQRYQDTGVAYPLFNSLVYEEPMFECVESGIFLPVATNFVNSDDVFLEVSRRLGQQ